MNGHNRYMSSVSRYIKGGEWGRKRERVGDSGEERERVWIVGKKGREWG